ncbi:MULTISPECIES: putative phage abortive infection protein [Pseudomonas]|uniref:putative phage abortive infection protein n=1 Tax=Pseudomonas TaxID=286 RepID=UPI0009982DFD|nr:MULTISPECIES: putative phage abortive infection protein [Pseudomonas]OOV97981.1 hypothetical protein MF6394_19500 [Pseudomonas sp. MF6394]
MKKISVFFYSNDLSTPTSPPSLHIKRVLATSFSLILLTVFSYGTFLIVKTWPITEYSIAKAGTFGDSFGALNSLFTGLGFAGLLVTIFLQREDLKLTRMELSETRSEIKLQSQTFRQQQFEESFYRLLSLYRDNLDQLSIKVSANSPIRIQGIDALSSKQQQFDEKCKPQRKVPFPSRASEVEKDEFIYELYSLCHSHFRSQSRYMETLNSILLLIQDDCFSAEKKEHYLNILSSQFTTYEIKYLFYQAFINPKYHVLRATLSTSPSFQSRFCVDSIPSSHYESFEYLWKIVFTRDHANSDRLFSNEKFTAAHSRIAKRRQQQAQK